MGREIRRVPPDWEHPRYTADEARYPWQLDPAKNFKPCYDRVYSEAAQEWVNNCTLWAQGQHPDQLADPTLITEYPFFWDYDGGPPDKGNYRTCAWTAEEATAYQIYETVTEGTPTSPVFPDVAAMRAWLLDQGYSEAAADGFIRMEWVPSLVVTADRQVYTDIETAAIP